MTVRGLIPPEGPQNVHRVPYNYLEDQGAHRFRTCVIPSPEALVLTGIESAQAEMEAHGLEEVPQDVADEALEVWQSDDSDRTVQDVLEDWRGKTETEAQSEDSGVDSGETDIPEDLESLDYHEQLLPLAEETGALEQADSRSTEDLISALEKQRAGE